MLELSNFTPVHWNNNQLPQLTSSINSKSIVNKQILKKEAEDLYKKDVEKAKKHAKKKMQGSAKWLDTVLEKGTSGDRVAAMVVLIQEDPIHNLNHLKSLVNLLAKDRRTALEVLQIAKELFLTELLISERKLMKFEQQPLECLTGLKTDVRNQYLKLWYFEDELKNIYFDFVKHVERLSKDTVESIRIKSTAILFSLLSGNPEQENYLLPGLINKIGDPSFKIASSSVHFLSKLTHLHPNMKLIIVKEVERLIYRSNVSPKAQYYAMCFMNGIILVKEDVDLATYLIGIYFSFFKAYIKKGEIESKMLSALLVGVNRAMPFAKKNTLEILKQTEVLYKLIRVSKFNTSIQALILMFQIITLSDNASDRFYSALYQKLFDPDLQHSSKLNIFFNLISKCLKSDPNEKRVQAFIKRLLQICLCLSSSFTCCVLLIISHLFEDRPQLKSMNTCIEHNGNTETHIEDEEDEKIVDAKSSWDHLKNISYRLDKYDPLHRNPIFCRADLECTYELVMLSKHYHPTVSIFANKLLKCENVVYSGDPLEDFNLRQFINRFISRNPKKSKEAQKEAIDRGLKRRKMFKLGSSVEGNVLGVHSGDDFIAKFYGLQAERNQKKKDLDEESVESIDDSEFDEYLDKFEKGLDGGDIDCNFNGLPKGNISDAESDDVELSDLEDDLSDEEMDLGNLGEFNIDDSEQEISEDEGDKSDDESILEEKISRKKLKRDTLFEAAEQYSNLIEETDSVLTKNLGSQDFTIKSAENKNQLQWEKKRNFKFNQRKNPHKYKNKKSKR